MFQSIQSGWVVVVMHETSISGNRDLHKLLSEPSFIITIALFTLLPYGANGANSTKTP
jgi:hypothetical protein